MWCCSTDADGDCAPLLLPLLVPPLLPLPLPLPFPLPLAPLLLAPLLFAPLLLAPLLVLPLAVPPLLVLLLAVPLLALPFPDEPIDPLDASLLELPSADASGPFPGLEELPHAPAAIAHPTMRAPPILQDT
jgi:hypothetical protein